MAIPVLFIALGAGTAMFGTGKSIKAAFDSKDAKITNQEATKCTNIAYQTFNRARLASQSALQELGQQKVEVLHSNMSHFVKSFSKLKNVNFHESIELNELKKLHIDTQNLTELTELSKLATDMAEGVAGGTLAGALTAFGAYGAAGWFATASTGTAISTLSGAAATNATLAFFGGGSLAAGGLGMAGGTAVLGGLVCGPAIAIMGIIVGAKASKNKNNAHANLAEAKKYESEVRVAVDLCYAIKHRCNAFTNLLKDLNNYFEPTIEEMDLAIKEHNADFSTFSTAQKKSVAKAVSLAKAIKSVLDTPILDKDGNMTLESARTLENIKPKSIIND